MERLSVQSLNSFLSYFEQRPDTVLWLRNSDFQRQLYISSNFEKIWGRPTELMYKDATLEAWYKFLHELDRQQTQNQIISRVDKPEEAVSLSLFRVVNPSGEVKFISDHTFLLMDANNKHIGYAGLAQILPEQEWHKIAEKNQLTESWDKQSRLKMEVLEVLQKELGITSADLNTKSEAVKNEDPLLQAKGNNKVVLMNTNQPILLTAREAECLYYLAAGKTAKQTAIALNVSPRTVVFHLDNIRSKAQCRTKIELLSKLRVDALDAR